MGGKLSRLRDTITKKRNCEETGRDPAVDGSKLEDRFYNNDSFKSPGVDPTDPSQQKAALAIQTKYRQHTAQKEVEALKEEHAAVKIQAGFRGYKDRQKALQIKDPEAYEKQKKEIDERLKDVEEKIDIDLTDPDVEKAGSKSFKARKEVQETKDAQNRHISTPVGENADIDNALDDPDADRAAIKIQAGYRGYRTRKEIAAEKKKPDTVTESQNEANEVIDIDLNDPEVSQAAIKIQAGFRGHKARSEVKQRMEQQLTHPTVTTQQESTKEEETIDIDFDDPTVTKAATTIQAGFRGHQARKDLKKIQVEPQVPFDQSEGKSETDEIDIDLTDPEVEKAALKIQASFKGLHTRREMKAKAVEPQVPFDQPEGKSETDEIDIDLTDPEVEKAALKIQASFKGLHTRREMKAKAEEPEVPFDQPEGKSETDEIDIDLTDPEVEKAALKIQASFKGLHTRREMKAKAKEEKVEPVTEPVIEKTTTEPVSEVDKSLSTRYDAESERAAVKIQAGYRGYTTRKNIKTSTSAIAEPNEQPKPQEEEILIDLQDPEVERAATKIQAGFKGYKARKEMASKAEDANNEVKVGSPEPPVGEVTAEETDKGTAENPTGSVNIDLNDPDAEKAAVKIQSSFKGYKTRKDLKSKSKTRDEEATKEVEKKDDEGEQGDMDGGKKEESEAKKDTEVGDVKEAVEEDVADQKENVADQKENVADQKENVADQKENVADQKEDVADQKEDVADQKEDVADQKEDVADQKEDVADQKEDVADQKEDEADQKEDEADQKENVADQKEDVADQKEDVADQKENVADQKEDVADQKENVADQKEDVADQKEDVADQKEDVADQKEDVADQKEDEADQKEDVADQKEDMADQKEDVADQKDDAGEN